jgi:protein ImuB
VDRWACVSVAELPLQLLLRREPSFVGKSVVVVSEDKPQGTLLWVNSRARKRGALPGQSYALALSLVPALYAGVVPHAELDEATRELMTELWRFSPRVEAAEEAGVFWLDASGLRLLYPQLVRWADELRARLSACGFAASVVVGFSRFGTYALARAGRDNRVFEDAQRERADFLAVPLACLDIEPEFRDVLHKLGVHSIEELLRLPAAGLLRRFGKMAYRLHSLAAGELLSPLAPDPWLEPLLARMHLDDAETDATRLLFLIKRLLDALLPKLVVRGEAVSALQLTCKLDRSHAQQNPQLGPELVRPAVPTLNSVELLDLVRLRLETLALASGVVCVELEAQGVAADAEQLRAFAERPRRDLAAGSRALARLRAELGDAAVVYAELTPGNLPEASFAWRPLAELQAAPARPLEASCGEARPLVRRIFSKPEPLESPSRHPRDDGWLIRGPLYGPVTHQAGPYLVSGGWWVREVQREYRMLITRRGDLLWVFHDRRRRRYFLQGELG